jgi:uncharacterized membrane protein YbhN (UPF0104 family)
VSRTTLAVLLQVAVSAVLLVALARKVPLADAASALARVRPGTIVTCVALALIGYWGRARRWALLLERSGVSITPLESYRLTLVGTFYGLATPGRVGELARIVHVGAPRSDTLPSVVWDRVVDVLILELLCVPAFLWVPHWGGPLLLAYLGVVLVTLAGIALLASPPAARALARAIPPLARPLGRWSQHSGNLLARGMSPRGILWGCFFYVFMYVVGWLVLRDLAPQVSARLILGQPLIALLGNLPVAFGGLGLREQVSATLFEQFGAGAATGAAYSLLIFTVLTLAPALLGFVASSLTGGLRRAPQGDRR